MSADLADRVASFLAAHHVMSLATSGPSGPHAANLFYACDGLALVWVSEPDTQHSRNIETSSRVAATIAPDYSDFATIRGVQISGTALRIVVADERIRQLTLLEMRFPFLRQLAVGPEKLQQAYARISVYRLEPARMVMIDNTKGFGHKETIELAPEFPK
jgi:uncharacterized protein YhbP (UPF0306 family)